MSEIEQARAEYRVSLADWVECQGWCGREQWDRRMDVIVRYQRLAASSKRLDSIHSAEEARRAVSR